jgi:hypothetical protein
VFETIMGLFAIHSITASSLYVLPSRKALGMEHLSHAQKWLAGVLSHPEDYQN